MENPIQRPIKTMNTHKVRDTPQASRANGGADAPSSQERTDRYGMKWNVNMFTNAAAMSSIFIWKLVLPK
jgi:hypothetical protein